MQILEYFIFIQNSRLYILLRVTAVTMQSTNTSEAKHLVCIFLKSNVMNHMMYVF